MDLDTDKGAQSAPHAEFQPEPTTLILGLGNTLLSDEGAGVYVVRELQRRHPDAEGVEYMDGGTLSFTLAGPIESSESLIVIDTAQLDSEPGTIAVFEGADMDHFVMTGRKSSVHEVSLLDLLAVTHLAGHLPKRRALVGIQPEFIDWGDGPTECVAAAIDTACEKVLQVMERWAQ
jgi:hydrogenase maturation protease